MSDVERGENFKDFLKNDIEYKLSRAKFPKEGFKIAVLPVFSTQC